MPEGMPQQSEDRSTEAPVRAVESEVDFEDSRLREGHIEHTEIPEIESVISVFTAADVLAELKAKDRPKVPEGKGKQKRGKNWKLDDIALHYDAWTSELAELERQGEDVDSARRIELQNRIDKADALLEVEAKRRTQESAEERLRTITSEKGVKTREKVNAGKYRKEGPAGVAREEKIRDTIEQRLKELDEKKQSGEAPPDVEKQMNDLREGLAAVNLRIAKRQEAMNMDEHQSADLDADLAMLEANREQAAEDLRQAKEEHQDVRRRAIEEYGEVLLELDPRLGPASEPLRIDMNAPKALDSKSWKTAKNVATIGGTTVGSMGTMTFGLGKDLFKSWLGFIKNPGKLFGGWKWKDFFWRSDGKKK